MGLGFGLVTDDVVGLGRWVDIEVDFWFGLAVVVFESAVDGGSEVVVVAGVAAPVLNGTEEVVGEDTAAMTLSICFSSTCSSGS